MQLSLDDVLNLDLSIDSDILIIEELTKQLMERED